MRDYESTVWYHASLSAGGVERLTERLLRDKFFVLSEEPRYPNDSRDRSGRAGPASHRTTESLPAGTEAYPGAADSEASEEVRRIILPGT